MKVSTKDKLERLASKQTEWRELDLERKLVLLEQMLHILQRNTDMLKETGRRAAAKECMGYSLATDEGKYEASMQFFLFAVIVKQHLDHIMTSYKIILGRDKTPKDLVISKKSNGQVAVKVFPILPSEKMGPNSNGVAELYVDSNHVTSEDDVRLLALDAFQDSDSERRGATVVLGAGNQSFLTVADVLQALFVWGRVVLVKNHPIREYQDDMIRTLFEPLITAGYMDCQSDADFDRSALYLGPDFIAGVHMTGGKATHDAIVWGHEKETRVLDNNPLLKCPMTSELGCVTPWIVTPFDFTERELESQVLALFSGVSNNASCNCNAPKVVIVSDDWPQLPEFLGQLTAYLDNRTVPAAYYPGAKQRWEQFKKVYPNAAQLGKGVNAKERLLDSPALPWLVIRTTVDLATEQGWEEAKGEYAFANEPFSPVLTIATIQGTKDTFLAQATKLCNEVLFGSLSASLSVPQNKMSDSKVEECLGDLRYGTVSVNAWSATAYGMLGCTWGAYPGEKLDHVESGIGQIHNLWFIPHAQKCVLRMPCVSSANDIYKKEDFVKGSTMFMSIGDFLLNPSVGTFVQFITTQVDVDKKVLYGAGAAAFAMSAFLVRTLVY